jgi:hypothetical protein
MKKGRGLAREFMAAYHMTRTYVMYLMLQLRLSRAVTLFIVYCFMAPAGDRFTFPFHLLKKYFISLSFLNLIRRFMLKVNLPKMSPSQR